MLFLKALILAGGFATRLRPLSCARPKTLFPIVNKPLLEWIFERLSQSDVDQAVLAVNALTQFYIRQHKISKYGLKTKFSLDPPRKPLGTAGPIKKAEHLLGDEEPFFVLNGDIFADLNYKELLKKHKQSNATATIALYRVEDSSRFGVAELGENNQIKRFIEKPAKGTAPTNYINAGIYVLSPQIYQYIPKGQAVSMERDVFPKLAAEGKLFGHIFEGIWMDIGKPDEYLAANNRILDLAAATQKRQKIAHSQLNKPVALDSRVSVGKKSVIGPYATIGKNTVIGQGAQISNSIIFPHASIGDFCTIDGAIIGEGVTIGKNVKLKKGCIVADHAKISGNLELKEQLTVCPGKVVTETF